EAPIIRPVTQLEITDELFETETPYNDVTLNWVNVQDNQVVIERSTDQENWTVLATVAVGVDSYVDEALSPNTLYYYRLKTITDEGESGYVTLDFQTMAIPTVPDAVSEPSPGHEATDVPLIGGIVELTWTGSENTVSYDVFF